MDCSGIDLVHPLDRMPPGSFGYLLNARVLVEGRIDGRPGYLQDISLADPPNSIRRLNDDDMLYASAGYIYVGGGGTNLYAGIESAYNIIDTGYSGNPLTLIPFRPDQSPESWMYVYDANKSSKVRPDGVVRAIGVAPPTAAPLIEYGIPANVSVNDGQSTSGWSASGDTPTLSSFDRTNSSSPTIVNILYNSGTTGWCCINPGTLSTTFWMGNYMQVILSGGPETVVVREIHNPIASTTVQSIQYDAGTTGLCSLVLVGSPINLERNSLIQIDSEVVRVLEVISDPQNINYSVRCSTTANHVTGATVTGLVSWYVYTVGNHVTSETISSEAILVSPIFSTGISAANLSVSENLGVALGRPIDPANDWLHISVFIQNPQYVTNLQLLISLDSTPNFSFTNPGNSYVWTITGEQLQASGSSGDSWVDVLVPISSATRFGQDYTLTLANTTGIALQMTSTAANAWGFDWWYLFGTYGEVIQPNSPTGVVYQSRFRDSSTGAYSVPGPQNRYQLYPLRESVIITPQTTTAAGVDTIDIYRAGGLIVAPTATTSLYVASVMNSSATPNSYTDELPDVTVLSANQPPDLTALQPWPTLGVPWSGTVNVVGTSVEWVSGTPFDLNLLSNTVILINGTAFLTYGQPRSDAFLELTQDAGSLTGATFQVASPTVAGNPLPFAFGPLEGPFAPVIFTLGDPVNSGLLYFSNFSNADAASDANFLEISTPSSPLISGAVWNSMAFAGSRDVLLTIRYSYLTTIGASNNISYQWSKVNTPSGIWSRWACCTCPIGVAYLGRDGIYIATDSTGVNITDEKLYPLFPHDGAPAEVVNSGSNVIYPVDMTQLTKLRLSYCDETLRFSYVDTTGNYNTLYYEIYKKRWFLNNFFNRINFHYLVESTNKGPQQQEILMGSLDTTFGLYDIMLSGGNTDNGHSINTLVLTPSADGGDQRSQKLYVDAMVQADGNGLLSVAATYDNAQSYAPVLPLPCTGSIQQFQENLASLADLSLYRNVGAKFAWTGGPDGPRVYAWDVAGFLQPYLSQFFVTQFIPFSFPGWKHLRRLYPALISNYPVLLTIQTQDGRTYGPYTIPSTSGRYRILPQMLSHGIKDLAFALQLDGQGHTFALFPSDFNCEVKQWSEETYVNLAIFRS